MVSHSEQRPVTVPLILFAIRFNRLCEKKFLTYLFRKQVPCAREYTLHGKKHVAQSQADLAGREIKLRNEQLYLVTDAAQAFMLAIWLTVVLPKMVSKVLQISLKAE